ncbi:MAG TPA: bifunctional demethylmenaquinone methyltransferase/2-methoxy-6-polyprenyl-1,4-benzoquinol methylase UbiE [Sedimentisphaerales bacterium]|nr:bifunctional demethylmenaquinone methyltransferase/2-methoxy-6-polyprenyl-1,4-benzoquinol methylase UbiE [Sedimentisphaerales bacterium]
MQKGVSTTSEASCPAAWCAEPMFDRIAPTYDLLNHLLSFGRDFSWRRKAARCIGAGGPLRVVDLATGTADLLIALLREHPHIVDAVGLDCSEEMLAVGRDKLRKCRLAARARLVPGDATRTTFADESFDVVTMAFGIRNTPDPQATLDEIHRLLAPGGAAVILEFSLPANAVLRWGHLVHLRLVVPLIGALVSGDRQAYRYLNQSIESFHGPAAFCAMMEQAGFHDVSAQPLTAGVASIYKGSKAIGNG